MSIKIALLKSGETVIADVKELIQDDKIRGYLLKKPHVVEYGVPDFLVESEGESTGDLQVRLAPWIILSKDEDIPVSPDWIVTIVEPVESMTSMYKEKTEGIEPEGESDDT